MLSAVLKRVKSVEKRLDKQGYNVEELRNKINGPIFIETGPRPISSTEVKEILLRYQAKFKEVGFEINHIKSKMTTQDENVQKIKLDLIRLRSEKLRMQQEQPVNYCNREQPLDLSIHHGRTQSVYNPTVEYLFNQGGGYHEGDIIMSDPPSLPQPPPLQHSLPNLTKEPLDLLYSAQYPRSTEAIVADRCVMEVEANNRSMWNSTCTKDDFSVPVLTEMDIIVQGQKQDENDLMAATKKQLLGDVNRPDPANLQTELAVCKNRIAELQAECIHKDRLLQELASKEEEHTQREREFLYKLEWCEHKMRLLKQDKRRRGETIGKLLRSIDEMKDAGKLDLSRLQETRGLLTSTLHTRGMSNEQRIQAAINTTDTNEKSPRSRDVNNIRKLSECSNHSGSDEVDSEPTTPRTNEATNK